MAGRSERPPAPEPLPGPVIDSHCHIDMRAGDHGELPPVEAVAAAGAVNVTGIVQVGCSLPDLEPAVRMAQAHDQIVAAIGIHPNDAPRLAARSGAPGSGEPDSGGSGAGGSGAGWSGSALDAAIERVEALAAAEPRVRGIGETGLDHYRTRDEAGWAIQEESFRRHIDIARRLGRALVIHDRDAHEDVLRILLDEDRHAGLPEVVIFHCFSGDAEMARLAAQHGWYLSFAGTVTFSNARNLHEAAPVVPRDRILVETDAPYLTPVPHRGKVNASYLVPLTVRSLAALREEPLEELCADLHRNTHRAFGAW